MLFVEDLATPKFRMIKIWFLCSVVDGFLAQTHHAQAEGIVSVDWYTREQLDIETVYPALLKSTSWGALMQTSWQASYVGLTEANF
jgi:hypothetical protein